MKIALVKAGFLVREHEFSYMDRSTNIGLQVLNKHNSLIARMCWPPRSDKISVSAYGDTVTDNPQFDLDDQKGVVGWIERNATTILLSILLDD